jgi:hypothetical protein
MEVIESIQAAISVVSKLRELSKKLENAEIKMLIADLSNDLADAKLHAANVKSEMAHLSGIGRYQATSIAAIVCEAAL